MGAKGPCQEVSAKSLSLMLSLACAVLASDAREAINPPREPRARVGMDDSRAVARCTLAACARVRQRAPLRGRQVGGNPASACSPSSPPLPPPAVRLGVMPHGATPSGALPSPLRALDGATNKRHLRCPPPRAAPRVVIIFHGEQQMRLSAAAGRVRPLTVALGLVPARRSSSVHFHRLPPARCRRSALQLPPASSCRRLQSARRLPARSRPSRLGRASRSLHNI